MLVRAAGPMKYVALGFGVIVVLALAIAPFSKRLIEQWSRSDVETRSRLVYNAVQNPVVRAIADGDTARLSSIFESVALDERILAVGLCDEKRPAAQSYKTDADDVLLRQGRTVGIRKLLNHFQRRTTHPGRRLSDRRAQSEVLSCHPHGPQLYRSTLWGSAGPGRDGTGGCRDSDRRGRGGVRGRDVARLDEFVAPGHRRGSFRGDLDGSLARQVGDRRPESRNCSEKSRSVGRRSGPDRSTGRRPRCKNSCTRFCPAPRCW